MVRLPMPKTLPGLVTKNHSSAALFRIGLLLINLQFLDFKIKDMDSVLPRACGSLLTSRIDL